jgi:hypothetical protein
MGQGQRKHTSKSQGAASKVLGLKALVRSSLLVAVDKGSRGLMRSSLCMHPGAAVRGSALQITDQLNRVSMPFSSKAAGTVQSSQAPNIVR